MTLATENTVTKIIPISQLQNNIFHIVNIIDYPFSQVLNKSLHAMIVNTCPSRCDPYLGGVSAKSHQTSLN